MTNIKVDTRVIVPDLEGRILLLQRNSSVAYDLWNLPGGKVEQGDYITSTAKKEVWEETGLEIYNLVPLFYMETPESKADKNHYISFFHLSPSYKGTPELNEESKDLAWIGLLEEINDLSIAFNHRESIEKYYRDFSLY